MKKLGSIALVTLSIAFIIWAMLYQAGTVGGPKKIRPGEKAARTVENRWMSPRIAKLPVIHHAIGTVRSREEIAVISRLPAARIIAITVRSGDAVKQGDVLVKLEDRDLQVAVQTAEENLKAAESRLNFATQDFKRYEKIVENGGVSRRDFDAAQNALSVSRAEVAMFRHNLDSAKVNLSYAEIRAPFDGVIAERLNDPGDLATPQNPILRMFDPTKLQLRIPVRESLIAAIHIDQALTVNIDALGRQTTATVKEIVPSVDAGSRTFSVNACLIGNIEKVVPGMFARSEIKLGEEQALVIPKAALQHVGQLTYLRVKTETGYADQLVQCTPLPNSGEVRVISGLSASDQFQPVPKENSVQ